MDDTVDARRHFYRVPAKKLAEPAKVFAEIWNTTINNSQQQVINKTTVATATASNSATLRQCNVEQPQPHPSPQRVRRVLFVVAFSTFWRCDTISIVQSNISDTERAEQADEQTVQGLVNPLHSRHSSIRTLHLVHARFSDEGFKVLHELFSRSNTTAPFLTMVCLFGCDFGRIWERTSQLLAAIGTNAIVTDLSMAHEHPSLDSDILAGLLHMKNFQLSGFEWRLGDNA
jgi:hypothetical protein